MGRIEVVCVLGHEGSGSQWLTWTLGYHPDISRVLHQSYPVDWRGSPYLRLIEYGEPGREYSDCRSITDKTAPVLVAMRDRTCSTRSNVRRGFFDVDPSRADRRRASEQMWADLAAWRGPVQFVSYEGLAEEGAEYLAWIIRLLGLDPQRFDWQGWARKLAPRDGNRKYLA